MVDILDRDSHCPYLLSGKLNHLSLSTIWRNYLPFNHILSSKIHKIFKQHPINIKNYTALPYDMVQVPVKFRENTDMPYVMDRRIDGRIDRWMDKRTGAFQYLPFRAFGVAGNQKLSLYGVHTTACNWLENYLHKSVCCMYNGVASEKKYGLRNSTRFFFLGPILFLIYY